MCWPDWAPPASTPPPQSEPVKHTTKQGWDSNPLLCVSVLFAEIGCQVLVLLSSQIDTWNYPLHRYCSAISVMPHMYVHIWGGWRQPLVLLHRCHPPCPFWGRVSRWSGTHWTDYVGWPASEPQESTYLGLSSSGVSSTCHHACLFYMSSGDKSVLQGKHITN